MQIPYPIPPIVAPATNDTIVSSVEYTGKYLTNTIAITIIAAHIAIIIHAFFLSIMYDLMFLLIQI